MKAVICHEFLHVLLRHTDRLAPASNAEHLALDSAINAIIHRTMGPSSSSMMRRYYARVGGAARLLRPPTEAEKRRMLDVRDGRNRTPGNERQLPAAWDGLYEGRLVADDIRDLARDQLAQCDTMPALLGNHDDAGTLTVAGGQAVSAAERQLRDALDTALKAMNGSGLFRSPHSRGLGADAYRNRVRGADCLIRGRARAIPSRFVTCSLCCAHVYLDVSGSMDAEMPLIVSLLGRLSPYIRRPFWAFSTFVAPARIQNGHLMSETTGGTSMACVLEHVARTRPAAAIVVSDGYIEVLEASQVAAVAGTRLHVIVTRDGTTAACERAGLPCTQLSKVPEQSSE